MFSLGTLQGCMPTLCETEAAHSSPGNLLDIGLVPGLLANFRIVDDRQGVCLLFPPACPGGGCSTAEFFLPGQKTAPGVCCGLQRPLVADSQWLVLFLLKNY